MMTNILAVPFLGLVSASLMTLTEFPFWKRWGMPGVAEWQLNWVTLSVLRVLPADEGPRASWKVITSHLIHGMVASLVFVALLPSLLNLVALARSSLILDALVYSLVLWVVFSVAPRRAYERAGGITIARRGIFVSLISHSVYGLVLGILVTL